MGHKKWFELIGMNCLSLPFTAHNNVLYRMIQINVLYTMHIIIMLFVFYRNKFYTVFNGTSTRSAARYWNNAKCFLLVVFSRSWKQLLLEII